GGLQTTAGEEEKGRVLACAREDDSCGRPPPARGRARLAVTCAARFEEALNRRAAKEALWRSDCSIHQSIGASIPVPMRAGVRQFRLDALGEHLRSVEVLQRDDHVLAVVVDVHLAEELVATGGRRIRE